MSMFLSETEIQELTGAKQISKQIEWLRMNNFVFEIRRDERISLARGYVEERLGITHHMPAKITPEPNWGCLTQGMQ